MIASLSGRGSDRTTCPPPMGTGWLAAVLGEVSAKDGEVCLALAGLGGAAGPAVGVVAVMEVLVAGVQAAHGCSALTHRPRDLASWPGVISGRVGP